jgi:hypothetical protein
MLALRALDAQGATLQAIEGEATTTYVHLCSTETMPVRLQVHALAGSGRYALTWYEAPLARIEPKGADDPLRAQLQQVEKSAQDAGYRPHTRFETGPLPVSLRLIKHKMEQIDKAISQFKRGDIQGVFLMRTDGDLVIVKRMPRILED